MGFWDAVAAFFRFLAGLGSRGSRRGPAAPMHKAPWERRAQKPQLPASLEPALLARRRGPPPTRKGKPVRPYRLASYEHLERAISLALGKFPWTSEEARGALAAKGFDEAAVRSYLASDAAQKLLRR